MNRTSTTTSTLAALIMASTCFSQGTPSPDYLRYATHLGGIASDIAFGVATDAEGNIFLAGYTASSDFLSGMGFRLDFQGGRDAVVVKIDPTARDLLSAVIIGGPGQDSARGIQVTPSGEVFIIGEVEQGFIPPPSACRQEVLGQKDVFVARLSNDLAVQNLHLLGGNGDEGPRGLHVSADGVLSVLGYTTSIDLETTQDALQPKFAGGGSDFFVARLLLSDDIACEDRVSYLTYLGSLGTDADPSGAPFPGAIVADASGLVTVVGTAAHSASFPSKPCSYLTRGGDVDGFVVQLRCDPGLPAEDQLVYGAIIGGSAWDAPTAVALTPEGRLRVAGATYSGDFPRTTPQGLAGENDTFVLELDPRCDLPSSGQLTFSTLIGGSGFDPATPLISLLDGSLAVGGISLSSNYPVTPDALGSFNGAGQAFLSLIAGPQLGTGSTPTRLSTPLSRGACSLWLECDRLLGFALHPDGTLLACGATGSGLLSVPDDAFQPHVAGGADMFLVRLDLRYPTASFVAAPSGGAASLRVRFDA